MVRFMRWIQPRGRPSSVALIVERNHFIAEDAIQVFAVALVVHIHVGVGSAVADGEPVEPVVGFSPPAVEDGEIEAAVEHDFLSAGAGGLERTARVVEPHIDALDQVAADVDVVVLDEDKLVAEPGVAHHAGNLLQDSLSRFVMRMRLAGEQELHGALGVIDHRGQALDVDENQVGPLVGREPARKPDGQRIGGKHSFQPS